MRFYQLLICFAFVISNAFLGVAQTSFKPEPLKITDETNRQPDHASRYVWGFENSENIQTIQGNAEHEFSCFGIGVAPSEPISSSDISIKYRINNGSWIKTKPDFSPETIARDNLYWTDLLFTPDTKSGKTIEIQAELPQGITIDSLKLHVINVDFNGKSTIPKNAPKAGACPAYPTVITRAV